MKQFDAERPDFSPYGFTCELWQPACMQRPDRHNEIELNLLTSGSLTYLLGGRRTTISANRLAVFWAAIPHQIVDFNGSAPYFVATLPLSDFLQTGIDAKLVKRILQGELLVDKRSDEADEILFHRWERELQTSRQTLEQAARLEMHARLLRLKDRFNTRRTVHSSPALSRADQLACHIAKNYQQPLTSQSIAEVIGVHANYAMNLFRKTFGTTMTTFITQHRIWHAQRLLVTTDNSILDVAIDSGFQSLSRFNEAFKQTCGCSPRYYRRAHDVQAPVTNSSKYA